MTVNPPLIVAFDDITMNDPNHWQRLALAYLVKQNGIIIGAAVQNFVCPHWDNCAPFSLVRTQPGHAYLDPGPPPQLGPNSPTDQLYRDTFLDVLRKSSYLTPDDPTMIDTGLNVHHNNPVGTNNGTGYPINPVTGHGFARLFQSSPARERGRNTTYDDNHERTYPFQSSPARERGRNRPRHRCRRWRKSFNPRPRVSAGAT